MTLTPIALVLFALLLAAWTVAALWAVAGARRRERKAEAGQRHARRLARMVDESPALPLLVRADGRIEAPQRLAGWLGLDAVPQFLTELDGGRIDGGGGGLTKEQLAELTEAVRRTQRTAAPFRMVLQVIKRQVMKSKVLIDDPHGPVDRRQFQQRLVARFIPRTVTGQNQTAD